MLLHYWCKTWSRPKVCQEPSRKDTQAWGWVQERAETRLCGCPKVKIIWSLWWLKPYFYSMWWCTLYMNTLVDPWIISRHVHGQYDPYMGNMILTWAIWSFPEGRERKSRLVGEVPLERVAGGASSTWSPFTSKHVVQWALPIGHFEDAYLGEGVWYRGWWKLTRLVFDWHSGLIFYCMFSHG
jgi:hypothetical protein